MRGLLADDGAALFHGLLDALDGRRVGALGGEFGRRGLDHGARLGEAGERHATEKDHRRDGLGHLIGVGLGHESAAARADLHVNEAAGFEHAQRVAHRDPRDAEPLGELALGLETIAPLELALEDGVLDLRDDLAGRARLPYRGEGDSRQALASAFCFELPADASSRYTTLS